MYFVVQYYFGNGKVIANVLDEIEADRQNLNYSNLFKECQDYDLYVDAFESEVEAKQFAIEALEA